MQLEGYALALAGGQWFIGVKSADGSLLKPAYEAHVRWMGDNNGNFGVLRECTPILGSTKLNQVELPRDCVLYHCEVMSAKERQAWASAILECEGLIQALKTAESGIVLPPPPGALIK